MRVPAHSLILGAGLSGLGAAELLSKQGSCITVLDQRPVEAWPDRSRFAALGCAMLGGETVWPYYPADLVVVSPGVPIDCVWIQRARAAHWPVVSELQLGAQHSRARIMAVTGSNGKSTVVKWVTESLQAAGLRAEAGGNYGVSACALACSKPDLDWLVLEVSSFQLETADGFRPEVALLTNIHPNHLDRHGSMAVYTECKARLFARQAERDRALVPVGWREAMQQLSGGGGTWQTFGVEPEADYRAEAGRVFGGAGELADLRETLFGAPGMATTAAAVVALLDAAGVDARAAEQAAQAFQPLPHRMQAVAEVDGVRYVDDSKATNLAALAHALAAMPGPVRLLAGGLAKENNFEEIKSVLAQRVKTVYLFGQAAGMMSAAWSQTVPCEGCQTLETAVARARADAAPGEVILLSPGCASFDQFQNYQQRGERFQEYVQRQTRGATS
jgi:UDP-N-acetylmuramoylalanine--D-glutamate ligase